MAMITARLRTAVQMTVGGNRKHKETTSWRQWWQLIVLIISIIIISVYIIINIISIIINIICIIIIIIIIIITVLIIVLIINICYCYYYYYYYYHLYYYYYYYYYYYWQRLGVAAGGLHVHGMAPPLHFSRAVLSRAKIWILLLCELDIYHAGLPESSKRR